MSPTSSAHGATLRYKQGDGNIATLVRRRCAQLFFVYTGLLGMPGMPPMTFLSRSGLSQRNIAMIRDPYNANFFHGVGGEIDDLDRLLEWQQSYRDSLTHVRETYCLGNSAGGCAAMMFGHAMGVNAVYAFAPRRAPSRQPGGLMGGGETGGLQSSALVRLLEADNGITEHHIYCSPQNRMDSTFAEYFAHCPRVTIHHVDVTDDYRGKKSHMIMSSMAAAGELETLFPPFVPA